jgi:hypothetical protein
MRLGDTGKQDSRRGVCGDIAAFLPAQSASRRIEKRQAQAARADGAQGGGSPGGGSSLEIGRRHNDGDAETAQDGLGGRRLLPGFSRGRQDHDQTFGRRDDQPPRGSFGRAQQPQYGAVEMTGQGPSRLAFKTRTGGKPSHGDKARQDALQRLEIARYRCRSVHRRPLSRRRHCHWGGEDRG